LSARARQFINGNGMGSSFQERGPLRQRPRRNKRSDATWITQDPTLQSGG